jgi:Protein of unknown function (DUF3152)
MRGWFTMIDEATRTPVAEPLTSVDRWRRWWLVALALALVAAAGFAVGRGPESAIAPVAGPTPAETPSASPTVTTPPTPTPKPITELLRLGGSVPTKGTGRFSYATTRGPVSGSKGPVRRFRVAVEKGSGEDAQEFAEQVAATLGDPRSWTGGGRLRLQMVTGSDPADFTVYLATRDTAGRMCERGGTNIRIGGVPFTSCRTTGKAIINLDRWRLSSRPYLDAKVPLATYRQYVINHEVGHELGHHHQGCPKAGGPAPVMLQQTITLRGCVPYAWPRRGSGWLTGPGL